MEGSVSIQLGSPTSGEVRHSGITRKRTRMSFHSISFPNEWGAAIAISDLSVKVAELQRGVSIQLVSPTSGEVLSYMIQSQYIISFHSISFPNEWGGDRLKMTATAADVSIQLVSPTSGEMLPIYNIELPALISCFHSISFPNEWGGKRTPCRL